MKSAKHTEPAITDLRWRWLKLDHMEPLLLYDMLAMREAIFVVEQTCIYQELDGLDKTAEHLLAMDQGQVVACLRLLPPSGGELRVRIGRVAVTPAWRKRGMATLMMQKSIERAQSRYPSSGICLNAQTYLQDFYRSLGFRIVGDEYLEDGIPHVPMQF